MYDEDEDQWVAGNYCFKLFENNSKINNISHKPYKSIYNKNSVILSSYDS